MDNLIDDYISYIILILAISSLRSLVALTLWARFARRKVADGLAALARRWPVGSLRSREYDRWVHCCQLPSLDFNKENSLYNNNIM